MRCVVHPLRLVASRARRFVSKPTPALLILAIAPNANQPSSGNGGGPTNKGKGAWKPVHPGGLIAACSRFVLVSQAIGTAGPGGAGAAGPSHREDKGLLPGCCRPRGKRAKTTEPHSHCSELAPPFLTPSLSPGFAATRPCHRDSKAR